jgi:DNA-binding transcriptional LysR family regulator
MGIGFLPRIALHPVHPGVVVKAVADSPTRRILAVTLAGTRSRASEAFLGLLAHYAAAYPELREPARV